MCNRWPFLVLSTVLFLVWIHFHKRARDTLILLTSVFTHPILCIEVCVCQVSCCSSSLLGVYRRMNTQMDTNALSTCKILCVICRLRKLGNKFTGLWLFWWLDCKLAKIKMKLIHSPSYSLPLFFTNQIQQPLKVHMVIFLFGFASGYGSHIGRNWENVLCN